MIFEVQNQLTISSATRFFHFSPLCRVRLLCKSHDMYLPAGRPQEIEILAEVLIPQLIGIYLHEEFFFDGMIIYTFSLIHRVVSTLSRSRV